MAAFKTGIELQQENLQKLAASNVKLAGGSTAQSQQNRGIGALLGTALAGSFMEGDAGVAAGDIIASQERPPETAADWAKVQKDLFQAGLEDDGLSLTAKIKGLQEVEKSFSDKTKVNKPITTDDDRTFVVDSIRARGADENSVVGTILSPMLDEGATPGQKGQVAVFRSSLAEKASTIHQQLIDRNIDGVDKSMIVQALLDNIETSKDILQPETGFLWFGQDAGVNTKTLKSTLDKLGNQIVKSFEGGMEAPIRVAPAQQTTQAAPTDAKTGLPVSPTTPEGVEVGSLIDEGIVDPGTLIENPNFKSAIAPINEKIQGYNKALKGTTSKGAIKEIKRLKQIEIEKSRRIREAFGQTIR